MGVSAKEFLQNQVGNLTFGSVLKSNRLGMQWTQQELAEKIGVTKASISQFESGKNFPAPKTMKKIASTFELSIDSFIRYVIQDMANAYGGPYEVELRKVG